ncbi:MAG: dihydroorotate dehydrogenase-like protein [Bacteroidales bacterium]|nr:dihydroorotate dehydrogenase-like protein [Bacteroidales bacterium]
MAELKTTYMGIELKNPLIVGASNLVADIENIKKTESAGAGAIVYKSLFEEQIQMENFEADEDLNAYNERNAEMISLFPDMGEIGPDEFLENLRKAKQAVNIPVFASLNCVYKYTWVDYAKEIEKTGVDGIELNFFSTPKSFGLSGHAVLEEQLNIIHDVKEAVNIPIAVKISPFYTNTLRMVNMIEGSGADAVVMFNKLFQPDIDINHQKMHFPYNFSTSDENRLPLRYVGLLAGQVNMSLAANTGIMEGEDMIKMLLAGADVVQVVTTLYKNGIDHITKMLGDVQAWMDKNNYASVDEFRGKLSREKINDPYAYKRAQYVDILMKSDVFKLKSVI